MWTSTEVPSIMCNAPLKSNLLSRLWQKIFMKAYSDKYDFVSVLIARNKLLKINKYCGGKMLGKYGPRALKFFLREVWDFVTWIGEILLVGATKPHYIKQDKVLLYLIKDKRKDILKNLQSTSLKMDHGQAPSVPKVLGHIIASNFWCKSSHT